MSPPMRGILDSVLSFSNSWKTQATTDAKTAVKMKGHWAASTSAAAEAACDVAIIRCGEPGVRTNENMVESDLMC